MSGHELIQATVEGRWDEIIDDLEVPEEVKAQAKAMPWIWKMLTFGLPVAVERYIQSTEAYNA